MLTIDNDYSALGLILARECKRRNLPFEQKELNGQGYGDVFFLGLDGRYSGEIKGAGEYLGDPDRLIQQLKAQSQNADHLYVFVYGDMEGAEDGNSYALHEAFTRETWRKNSDSGIRREFVRHHTRVNYTAARKILWRIRQEGFHVIECRNLEELASELCNWYECGTTLGTTFTRLQPEKYYIREEDAERRNLTLTLMGIQPKWGGDEKVSEAVVDCLAELNFPLSIQGLFYLWNSQDYDWRDEYKSTICSAIERQPLRSSLKDGARKRRVGEAAVKKLRKALGVSE